MTVRQSKILGGLLAAAVGDAMGAVTEIRTTGMIKERFGGYVKDLIDPPDDTWARWAKAGMVTDDFSVSYFSAQDILENGGEVTGEVAARAVIRWSEHPLYSQCAGPTTRAAIARLKGEALPPDKHDRLLCHNSRASNGAPMKSGCVGLFDAGDVDKAIDDAITMCMVTHDNTIALSAAAAIAAATARAMDERVSYFEVIQAGIYGAREGFARAEGIARPVAGASVEKRIWRAVEIGLRHQGDFDRAMGELADEIGGGLPANEAVPAAFGYIAATGGSVMQTIYMAVNAGDDTDTVACMAGYIVGALGGVEQIPGKYLSIIETLNGFELQTLALGIDALLSQRRR